MLLLVLDSRTSYAQTRAQSQHPIASVQRRLLMADQTERAAYFLVRAMHRATDGERRWWGLPTKPNDFTKDAIALAVVWGWMLDRGDSVCLTDAGRDLVERSQLL